MAKPVAVSVNMILFFNDSVPEDNIKAYVARTLNESFYSNEILISNVTVQTPKPINESSSVSKP